jgi:PEP-CTERM motif
MHGRLAVDFVLASSPPSATGVQYIVFYDSLAVTAAIPEPETYALMMVGLGLLGFVARRRKKLIGA